MRLDASDSILPLRLSPRRWAGRVVVNACLFCIMHAPIRLIYAAGRIPILYYCFYSILYDVQSRLEGKC